MAVARDDSGTNFVSGASVSTLTLSTLTVGSGSNHYGVVALATGDVTTTDYTVTWSSGPTTNVAMGSISGGRTGLSLWVTSSAPITGNIVASWSGAYGSTLGAVVFSGVNQTTPRVVGDDFSHASTGTEASPESHIEPSATNDATLGAFHVQNGFSSVNQTQIFLTTADRTLAANYALGSTANTMSATFSNTPDSAGGIYIHIQAAGAAASVVSPRLLALLGTGS